MLFIVLKNTLRHKKMQKIRKKKSEAGEQASFRHPHQLLLTCIYVGTILMALFHTATLNFLGEPLIKNL